MNRVTGKPKQDAGKKSAEVRKKKHGKNFNKVMAELAKKGAAARWGKLGNKIIVDKLVDFKIEDHFRDITKTVKTGLNGDSRSRVRELVRIRDNHICKTCGKVWKKGQRRFDVHHIDVEMESGKSSIKWDREHMDRMITLCHKCHFNLNPSGSYKIKGYAQA